MCNYKVFIVKNCTQVLSKAHSIAAAQSTTPTRHVSIAQRFALYVLTRWLQSGFNTLCYDAACEINPPRE